MTTYRRIQHAAHYGYGSSGGHDLETWTFAAPINKRPTDVPHDAEYHSGYVDSGVQHWVYTRIAPMSGTPCNRCSAETKGARP